MAYRLPRARSIRRGAHRVADAQLRRAIEELTHVRGDRTVHVARRRVKKVRALLQLVATGGSGRRSTRTLRTVSRMLGPIADGEAAARTFARLCASSPQALPQSAERAVQQLLSVRQERVARRSARVLERAARLLVWVRTNLEHTRVRGRGFDAVEHGLRDGLRRGRRAMRHALSSRTDEAFHAWRRRVKMQWLQLRLLEGRTDDVLRPLASQLETLDGLLGEHHDVALLEATIVGARGLSGVDTAACLRLLRSRKATLRHEAAALGATVHAPRPHEVVQTARLAWQAKARTIPHAQDYSPPRAAASLP